MTLLYAVELSITYKMENMMTIFLESNEAARLYLLHLFVGASWHLSEIALSANIIIFSRFQFIYS